MMDEQQQLFLSKRKKITQQWKWAGAILFGWSCLLYGYLFFFTPLLANPFYVIKRINNEGMEQSTLELMAVLLPVVSSTLFLVILIFLLLGYVVFSNEKKYQEIISSNKNT